MIDLTIQFDNAVQTDPVPAIGAPKSVQKSGASSGHNALGS